MNTKKHTDKLQKSSLLFFQLGLILALLTAYVAIEHKTEVTTKVLSEIDISTEVYTYNQYDNIKIEEKVVEQKKRATQKKIILEQIEVTKKETSKETDLSPIIDEPKEVSKESIFEKLVEVPTEDPLVEDFISVQEKPIFPGCEKVKKSKRKACFEKKMSKHISNKFNGDLASSLGLSSGKKRIFVEFIITKTGDIKITNAKAPHKSLEKEGKRVVNKLPKMTPGKQNGKEVNVKYLIPIIFDVN